LQKSTTRRSRVAAHAIAAAGSTPLVLYPGDAWEVGDAATGTEAALAHYDRRYGDLATLPLRPPGASVDLEELRSAFEVYRKRIFAHNSRWLIALLSRLRPLGAFQPVTIRLRDLDRTVVVSVMSGFAEIAGAKDADVTMHSSSLLFMFKNEFGFDTLTVNGRFEAGADGFGKMMRSFAVGSLNALGLSISWRLLFNMKLVLILARHLTGVLARLRRPEESQSAPAGSASR
jgi:hypothetical protein